MTSFAHRLGENVAHLPGLEDYALVEQPLHTPALLVYPEAVDRNIAATLRVLGGDPDRWRPHVKTAKLGFVMRRIVSAGVRQVKCATTLEMLVACEAGVEDALLAYPAVGPRAERLVELARTFSEVRVSALVERPESVRVFSGTPVSLFVDVNPGANRTGIPDTDHDRILATVRAIVDADLEFRGLHYYDGHLQRMPAARLEQLAHQGYGRLLKIVETLEASGLPVREVITAGTPALPATASFPGFRGASFVHRASPGTVVYNDLTSLSSLPPSLGYAPAVLVATTVVSHPAQGRITCDAGHKTVSADSGVPTCTVLGRPELEPLSPSEEHLPIAVPAGADVPEIGSTLYLLPRHVCPTVNNFDVAVLVERGRVTRLEAVSARGREAPIASAARSEGAAPSAP